MTKEQIIERIISYLPLMDEGVLLSVLTLLERIQPEDDAWDKQIQADAEAGLLDNLMTTALKEFEAGETEDLPNGLETRRKEVFYSPTVEDSLALTDAAKKLKG